MPIITKLGLAMRAVRLKLRLLTTSNTFWPAVARGGKLLLAGRVGEFSRKLFNEQPSTPTLAAPHRTDPPLFLAGQILGLGGYDHLVLNVLKGLTDSGVNVCGDRGACFSSQIVPAELQPEKLRRGKDQSRLIVAPPHHLRRYRPDARSAVFTMWETDTLPAGAAKQLNRCGLVIVPSRWGAACFRANGVTARIEIVPLGHDPVIFRQIADVSFWRAPEMCVFGTAGALDDGGLRKNVQRVIDLFRKTFPSEPDARLRVKITPNSPPVDTHGDPRVEVIAAALSPHELADWYRSLDVFVNASAGEGFGLHLLEAMACGVPLISSTFGGVGAFFDSRVGYEVRYRPAGAWHSHYRGIWSDPDDRDIVARMRQVYANRAGAKDLGAAAATRAAKYRWEDTTRRLVIALIQNGFIRPAG